MVENSDNFIVNNLELYGTKTLKNQNLSTAFHVSSSKLILENLIFYSNFDKTINFIMALSSSIYLYMNKIFNIFHFAEALITTEKESLIMENVIFTYNQGPIIKCTDSDTLSLNKVSFMNNYNQLYDLVNDIEVTSKYTNNQTKININNSIFFVIDISSTSNLIFNKFTDCLEISIFSCIFQGRSFSQAIYLYS